MILAMGKSWVIEVVLELLAPTVSSRPSAQRWASSELVGRRTLGVVVGLLTTVSLGVSGTRSQKRAAPLLNCLAQPC